MNHHQQQLLVLPLSDLANGQEADVFALLTSKEEISTRDGKKFFRVGFRDAEREVNVPIWSDSPFAQQCRDEWTPGEYYKMRGTFRETVYGPQFEIQLIRPARDTDASDGFDPLRLVPHSRFDPAEMFEELTALAQAEIPHEPLREVVLDILLKHRTQLLSLPAATRHHHAFVGGFLEHVLCVTKTCVYLADKYAAHYPDLRPPLDKGLVVAGGILHDIGKLRELRQRPQGPEYTAAGNLVGHVLQGRDILREAAAGKPLSDELLLRLEHIIVSHQRLPEWGSPKPPMTPEALLVHYADDVDAKFNTMHNILREDQSDASLTSSHNVLRQKIYKGGE